MQHVVKRLTGEPLSIDQLVEYLRALSEVLTQLTLRIDRRRTLPVAHVRSSACANDSRNNEKLDTEDAAVATKPCVPLQ
jgi:hypothetical protein